MRVAALQIAPVGLSPNRLDHYLRVAKSKDAKVMLLPEYVLNRFFHELKKMPRNMLSQQSQSQIETLKRLAKEYDITIVAPIIRVQKEALLKSIAIVRAHKTTFYDQQILISYPHWNEERFFDNPQTKLNSTTVFRVDDLKFGVLPGYEIHFDWFWQQFIKKNVDVVLVPSASTFGSQERWRELLKMRAFTSNTYVIRANRIGEYEDENSLVWKFYGKSLGVDPGGKVLIELGESEELMIQTIDKARLKEARREWGFRTALRKRGVV